MTERIHMDGFAAAIFAVESFTDIKAALHGPGGCRSFHSFIAKIYGEKGEQGDSDRYDLPYFFKQQRLPCTYIDEFDYINGSEGKLRDAIPYICDVDGVFTVFIKSPGAALIGDSITDIAASIGYSDKLMAFEESLISMPFPASYDHVVKGIAERFVKAGRAPEKHRVNLLGLPMVYNDAFVSKRQLTEALAQMGLEVISCPGCGCSTEELAESSRAEFNIAVCPEYCRGTAEFYRSRFGIETVFSPAGAPVGFDAYETWVRTIAEFSGADPGPVLDGLRERRSRAYRILAGSVISHRMKLRTFAAYGDASVICPLVKWLHSYLNMVPASVGFCPGGDRRSEDDLREYLEGYGLGDVFDRELDAPVHAVLADGNTADSMVDTGACSVAVSLCAPAVRRISFLERPVFGPDSGLYFLDSIYSDMK